MYQFLSWSACLHISAFWSSSWYFLALLDVNYNIVIYLLFCTTGSCLIIFTVKIRRGALCALSLYDQDACCSRRIASFKYFSEPIFSAEYH